MLDSIPEDSMKEKFISVLWIVPLFVAFMCLAAARECLNTHRPFAATVNSLAGTVNIGLAVWVYKRARRTA